MIMKKLVSMTMAMAMMAALFVACGDDGTDDETPPPAVPTIALDGGDIDQPQEITTPMSVKVSVTAPGAIEGFTVTIDSPALTAEMLATVGLATELNLVNPGSMAEALGALGFPSGNAVSGKTALAFDISALVPMIAQIYHETSDHKFILKVTDAKGQSTTKTLTCHLTAAPTIALDGGDIDQPQEITTPMSVKVSVTAPGAIEGFTVTIDSPALTAEMLATVGLATELNLVNPGSMAEALGALGFPSGDAVSGKTALTFDISALVPMIAQIYNETSDHKFILKVTDAKGKSTTKTLTCHLTGKAALTYNNDADLWANTATVTAANVPEGGSVQYRVKGAADWTDAVLVEGAKYSLAPVWTSAKNDAELDIHSIQAGTGIFAATTYEVRVAKDGETLASKEFATAAGDKIPNGDMSGWSKRIWLDASNGEYPITYPNPEGVKLWDSGNNAFLEQYNEDGTPKLFTPLCREDETEAGTAILSAQMVMGFVFAPGNMFTGDFNYTGLSGTVNFGKPYAWTARPRALKVRYKAQVGKIDKVGSNDPDGASYKDKQDRARIFVAVVDWTAQHGVTSGMTAPTGMWDPATMKSVDEGAILGYGDLVITQTAAGWIEATLPIDWYVEKAGKPAADKFSLVISCATSVRGDYLSGCSTNTMQVDDFEWVY